MKAATTIQVRSKGTITLPKKLRDRYQVQEGDIYTLIDLGEGHLMLAPGVSRIDYLADEIGRILKEGGITLEEMLEALDEERERYYQEHYVQADNISR